MGHSQTFQWFSWFKAFRTSTDDDERSGQPVSSSMPEMIERVRQIIREDRRHTTDEVSMLVGADQWQNNTRLLHNDNVPAHAALLTRWFLTSNNMTVMPHPPYSPDLAPSDFFLFPNLHPATFSYFQNWKWHLRGEDFRRRKFKQSCRPSWTSYEKMTFKNTSKTGSATGIVVKPQKGTTLKVMLDPNI